MKHYDAAQTQTDEPLQKKKPHSALRKIKRYLEQQAQEQSHSALYLSPRAPQWQQETNSAVSTSSQYTNDHKRSLSIMTASSASGSGVLQQIKRHQYASDNILQSYDVLVPERDSGVWVVYIHGGYFRDPTRDSTGLKPAISLIEESQEHSELRSRVRGYASLNYRLSPHPNHPQDPSRTPSYTLRNARWPEQPEDIIAALRHLHQHYPASRDYVLVGHSVGATLTFITLLRGVDAGIALPRAVVGVSGIYDFVRIHQTNPEYVDLTSNAMTPEQFVEASPALYAVNSYDTKWKLAEGTSEKRVVVLAHSKDDGLVGWDQVEEAYGIFADSSKFQTALIELHGKHDEIWEKGGELVRAIQKVVEMI